MHYLIALLLLIPATTFAQDFTANLDADFTADGLSDRVELKETPAGGAAGINIWRGQADGTFVLETTASEFVWVGGEAEKPLLFHSRTGDLEVFSINRDIARTSWDQKLTISWYNGSFAVTKFTYSWRDAGKDTIYTCKADLLAGEVSFHQQANGVTDGANNEIDLSPIALESWNLPFPKECEPVSF